MDSRFRGNDSQEQGRQPTPSTTVKSHNEIIRRHIDNLVKI